MGSWRADTLRLCTLKFLLGVEDKQPFIWQLAVFLESLDGKLPEGWESIVVVCNDHDELSPDLSRVLSTYRIRHYCAPNRSRHVSMDFIGGTKPYGPINKITVLETAAPHIQPDDNVCLTDSDVFLYGDLNTEIFPDGNALCDNWLIKKPLFYSDQKRDEGVDLEKLLESIGVARGFRGGGVIVFLKGETLRNQAFIRGCFRFTQVLYLLGKIKNVRTAWIAEMPAYALSLAVHEIDYEIVDRPEFAVETDDDRSVPEGSFYHYYARSAFWSSPWAKAQFQSRDLLRADLERFDRLAQSAHEKYFFALAAQARARLDDKAGPPSSPTPRSARGWIEGRVADPLRYLHFHIQAAMDHKAASHRDLKLSRTMRMLYAGLSPIRGLRRRIARRG